jgi:hypothetical protein
MFPIVVSMIYLLAPEQVRRSKEALLVKFVACSWGGAWGCCRTEE